MQDLSPSGSGSDIPRLSVTFWKEGDISETTKLFSVLIWCTAPNSCKSRKVDSSGVANKVKSDYNKVLPECIVFRRGEKLLCINIQRVKREKKKKRC